MTKKKTTNTKPAAEAKGRAEKILDRFEASLPESDKSKATKKAAKAKPATAKNLFGYSLTAVARWLGANGVNAEQGRAIFNRLKVPFVDTTLTTGLSDGRTGKWGKPAPLTSAQGKELLKLKK